MTIPVVDFPFNGEHSMRLAKRSALIWPADCFWVHEVSPIQSGTRYRVNSFIASIPESLETETVERLNSLPKHVVCPRGRV
jgi:hypothetical protein